MIGRLLNAQGIIGIAVSLLLSGFLLAAKLDVRHWKKQSGQFEQLYRAEQAAFAGTVANYRAAAEQARAADAANKARVEADQAAINERTRHDYEARIADARARAGRLHPDPQGAAHSGSGGSAPVPGLRAAASGAAQAACDRLPASAELVDWKLCATEQAIQLDELINAVMRQAGIDVNGKVGTAK